MILRIHGSEQALHSEQRRRQPRPQGHRATGQQGNRATGQLNHTLAMKYLRAVSLVRSGKLAWARANERLRAFENDGEAHRAGLAVPREDKLTQKGFTRRAAGLSLYW